MTASSTTIGFVGGGNMTQAIIRGLLRAGHAPGRLLIGEPDTSQQERLRGLGPGLQIRADNAGAAGGADVLVLAVKPQLMAPVAAGLATMQRPAGQLIMSIAAGTTLASLAGWLGGRTPLVRVMPNQPALIGAGVSALVAAAGVSTAHRQLAQYVAAAMGKVIWLDDESLMDAVTAISGSGPAYFYLLIELLEQAAVELGLSPELARTLTRETALGAARAASESGQEPGQLRAAVTSPGGTTAAAISVFEQAGLSEIVRRALTAARDRSAALGRAPDNKTRS